MFSPEEIKAITRKALATDITIPEGHKGAVVLIADLNKVQIVTAIKINEHWSISSVAEHTWTGDNNVGVISKVTWQ